MPVTAEVSTAAVNRMLTAQVRKPCEVSRKATSSVWSETHLVRNRPPMYPPSAEAATWISRSHTPVPMPKVLPLSPSSDQGDIAERPRPVPRSRRISESAAAAAAPAMTAAQETALGPEAVGPTAAP
jgi:hypothetical protein